MEHPLVVNFSRAVTTDIPYNRGGLRLEQQGWGQNVGKVSSLTIVRELAASFGVYTPPSIDCGLGGGGEYVCDLYVYLFDRFLNYQLGITHGTITGFKVEEVEVEENIDFSLNSTATMNYTPVGGVTLEWVDEDVWGEGGSYASKPSLSANGDVITSGDPVYGSVLAKYKTFRHVRQIKIPPRMNAVDNIFASWAWARWDGGETKIELNPPPGASQNYQAGMLCDGTGSTYGGSVTIDPGGDGGDDPPKAIPSDKTIDIEYCTQEKQED